MIKMKKIETIFLNKIELYLDIRIIKLYPEPIVFSILWSYNLSEKTQFESLII